jgi:hypothetical protein
MRATPWIGLCTALLLGAAGLVHAADRKAGAPGDVKPDHDRPAPVAGDTTTWDVVGYGQTPQDAERSALDKATEQVKEWLEREHPELAWAPTPAYLRQSGVVSQVGQATEKELERAGLVWSVKMRVEIGPKHVKEMTGLARQQRMQERHRIAGWVLLGVVLLLVVGLGYLRVEDATRGYLTGVLRVGTAVLAALIVAGIWWFAQ